MELLHTYGLTEQAPQDRVYWSRICTFFEYCLQRPVDNSGCRLCLQSLESGIIVRTQING